MAHINFILSFLGISHNKERKKAPKKERGFAQDFEISPANP
jgi:hypothetical protein